MLDLLVDKTNVFLVNAVLSAHTAACRRPRDVVSGTTVRAVVLGRFIQKVEQNRFERYGQKNE